MKRLTVLTTLVLIAMLITACGGTSSPTDAELTQTIDARIAQAEGQIEVLAGNLPTPDFDVTAGAATARALAGANVAATSQAVQTRSANETPIVPTDDEIDSGASGATGSNAGSGGSAAGTFGESDGHDTILMGAVTLGTPASGDLVGVFDAHNWTFQGTNGQAVRIRVAPVGQGDFEVVLFGPAGQRLSEVDGGGDGATEQINRTLAANGVFTIRIRAWVVDQYTLTVTNQ